MKQLKEKVQRRKKADTKRLSASCLSGNTTSPPHINIRIEGTLRSQSGSQLPFSIYRLPLIPIPIPIPSTPTPNSVSSPLPPPTAICQPAVRRCCCRSSSNTVIHGHRQISMRRHTRSSTQTSAVSVQTDSAIWERVVRIGATTTSRNSSSSSSVRVGLERRMGRGGLHQVGGAVGES